MPDFQRARSAAAKQLRESAILEAARALGAERGIRQITLTDIGEAIGMAEQAFGTSQVAHVGMGLAREHRKIDLAFDLGPLDLAVPIRALDQTKSHPSTGDPRDLRNPVDDERSSPATFSRGPGRRPHMTTSAPCSLSASAKARPMPVPINARTAIEVKTQ